MHINSHLDIKHPILRKGHLPLSTCSRSALIPPSKILLLAKGVHASLFCHRFLLKHQEDLGAAAHTSIRALGLVQSAKASQLVVLEPQTPTLLAYENLSAAGVTGAPIISPQGELIANLSISDIRCGGVRLQHTVVGHWKIFVCGGRVWLMW